MKILVINGPNLNLLGVREPERYGTQTYEELVRQVTRYGEALGIGVTCFQSNHEGDLVDAIQGAAGRYDGIVINPAAYTHTSIAILDALLAVGLPAVEVHLTEPLGREEFRHRSFAGLACAARFAGLGPEGYLRAIDCLRERLGRRREGAQ